MDIPQECREFFLDGITDVFLYPVGSSTISIPFSVAQILKINDCDFKDPLIHITTYEENNVIADSITAKTTLSQSGNGTIYTIEINVNLIDGKEQVANICKSLDKNDFYVVLRKVDGAFLLAYTLPNTFLFQSTVSLSQTDETRTITITTKSMSDLIPITLK